MCLLLGISHGASGDVRWHVGGQGLAFPCSSAGVAARGEAQGMVNLFLLHWESMTINEGMAGHVCYSTSHAAGW